MSRSLLDLQNFGDVLPRVKPWPTAPAFEWTVFFGLQMFSCKYRSMGIVSINDVALAAMHMIGDL